MSHSPEPSATFDVAVLGAGFGGLSTALTLAEGGARVVVLETLGYAGGCAATFKRQGHRFEAGATLFSGFGEGQLMRRWIDRHGLAVKHEILDPVVELRAPGLELAVPPRRRELVERFCALPEAPAEGIRAFFALQERIASSLWALFDDPELLPPLTFRSLLHHLGRFRQTLPLLPWIGRSLESVLERFGVASFQPLRLFLDATCQITVQASVREAEALFALSALDYYFRGTGHLHGGVGTLAGSLVGAIEALGGEVRFFDRAEALEPLKRGYRVRSRRGEVRARVVVANLLPQAVAGLLGRPPEGRLRRLDEKVETGWGAAMLYLALPPGALDRASAHHLELVQDPASPLIEGNHLFCSVSGEDEKGRTPTDGRTVTVSTHIPLDELRRLDRSAQAEYVEGVQDRMRNGLAVLAPEIWSNVERSWPASPRTFQRFTGRPHGYVGGIPRRRGLANYLQLGPLAVAPDLYLVGDTVFPGQSTLATALGGQRLATHLLRQELRG